MIGEKRVLALIPARGGSKGIKGKNIIPLAGKPLIAYSIEAAKESRYIDRILVSTDSEEIRQVSENYGASAPFLRPAELSSDTAKTIDVLLHTREWLRSQGEEFDILVLLQPTQPLRRSEDIDRALEIYTEQGEAGLVSVREVDEHPILMRTIGQDGRLKNLLSQSSTVRRQDMPPYYIVDGSIYINAMASLTKETSLNDNPIPYCMARENSVDIDELQDLERAEMLLKRRDQETFR